MLEAALNTVSIGYEGANKYKVRVAHKPIVAARHCWVSPTLSRTRLTQVRDPAGRPIYFVVEDSGCCSRQCCNPTEEGAGAPFAVDVVELIEAPAAEVIARAQ